MKEITVYYKIRWKRLGYAIGLFLFAIGMVWMISQSTSTGNKILFGFGALFFLAGAIAVLIQSIGKRVGLSADKNGLYHPDLDLRIPWDMIIGLPLTIEGKICVMEVRLVDPERFYATLDPFEFSRVQPEAERNIAAGYEGICFDMHALCGDAKEIQKTLLAMQAQARIG